MAQTTPKIRRIEDAGEKIGGARKDWKQRFLDLSDLEDMTNDEAIANVKKDNVWPQPKWDEVVAQGMPAEVAALVKAVRDSLAKEPHFTRNAEPDAVRRGYVKMTSLLRDMLMSSSSVDEVRSCYVRTLEAIGKERLATVDPETRATLISAHRPNATRSGEAVLGDYLVSTDPAVRAMFFSVYAGRSAPFAVQQTHMKKARKLLSEGFPDKSLSWRKGYEVLNARSGGVVLLKGYRQVGVFPDADAAWKWLEQQSKAAPAEEETKKDKKEEPKHPHLDRLTRGGMPDRRDGRDVTPDDFISTFGFRGVEFGNYLPDSERQQVLNLAFDALHDLAHVLDWEPSRLSLEGTLAVAFGARGRGGKAAAHYEPGRRVLNMTRLRGAGKLAHEYGHAIDHWSGDVDFEGQSQFTRSATGWENRIPEKNLRASLTNLSPEQVDAWVNLLNNLYTAELPPDEALKHEQARLKARQAEMARHAGLLAKELEKPKRAQDKAYINSVQTWIPLWTEECERIQERIRRREAGEPVEPVRVTSDYYREASKLCGKSGTYWKQPCEMMARGFEAYVYDRIREMGARSDYLVHGVEEDRFSGPGYKGNPYPVGRERAAINEMIGAVVSAMKPRVELDLGSAPTP